MKSEIISLSNLSNSYASGLEKLQVILLMIITPLTFHGGSFYSIDMLPSLWQEITLFNPVVYLESGFRWSFYVVSDMHFGISQSMIMVFLSVCLFFVWFIFKTGDRLKK
jgi:ABC-2 type transport system permease protein